MRERTQLMLCTATSLPLIVALTEIGLANGTMRPENAAALVGAGVLSVMIFPALAVRAGVSSICSITCAPGVTSATVAS